MIFGTDSISAMDILTAQLSAAHKENQKLRDALTALNYAIEAYWIDPNQTFEHMAQEHIQRITKAQNEARNALSETND